MRGLVKYKDGKFEEFIEDIDELKEQFEMPEDEVNDKSKGNFLTKLLIVLQTTWFIFQCLARWITHLPVMELEVVTLAFAFLNIITYGLWWNKPQNMLVAIPVHVRTPPTGSPCDKCGTLVEEEAETRESREVQHPPESGGDSLQASNITRPSTDLEILTVEGERQDEDGAGLWQHMSILPLISLLLCSEPQGETSRMLYASEVGLDDWKTYFPFCIIATVFGCLHLIPVWVSSFPSYPEKVLWEVSALVVTIQPALIICMKLLAEVGCASLLECFSHILARYAGRLARSAGILEATAGFDAWAIEHSVAGVLMAGWLGYAVACLILIILAFTALRNVPSDAYRNITWSTFIPHF